MNKVITINLNGNAYPLEENGYEALRTYLDTAARRLEDNPDRAEIIADIEQAIADKFRAVLGANKTVVVTAEVERVIIDMGPVEDASTPPPEPPPGASDERAPGGSDSAPAPDPAAAAASGTAKRLYRIRDGAKIAGVCNGLAAYFNIDVTVVRVLFALLVVLGAIGVPVYILLILLLPEAHTSAEKAAAYGAPSTAEEFIRRAREGYYEGMKTFHDRRAHRQWKRKFKQEMRGWKHSFRQEMRAHADSWRQPWPGAGAPGPRSNFAGWIFVPLLSLIIWAVGLVALFAALSLLFTGAIFGVPPPHGVPLWTGLLILIVAFHVLAWPFRALRYSLLFRGCPPQDGGGSLGGLAFLILVIWLANRRVPEVHHLLENLPPFIHHTADSLQRWWARR